MSLLPPSTVMQVDRAGLEKSLSNPRYTEEFKRLVLARYEQDHVPGGSPWAAVMLLPHLDSEEGGEVVPYEVCMMQFQDGTYVGLCVNTPMKVGRAMPMRECMELWNRLVAEKLKQIQNQGGSGV